MFKAPFSFSGRIRRTEYWLSNLIQVVAFVLIGFVSQFNELLGLLLWIPLIWFVLAYCTKRCHDRGNPGIFMLIPFYGLWMAFAEGEPGPNKYGDNPKSNP